MTTNYIDAIDEMFSLFLAAWNAGSGAIVGYIPVIVWPDSKTEPEIKKFYCKVSQQTVNEDQSALKCQNKRYENNGLIFVQIFCPSSDVAAKEKGRLLAVVARDAFRGNKTSGGVVFHKTRIQELLPQNGAERFNVVSEYQYDEST
jgi:hypothetical protein